MTPQQRLPVTVVTGFLGAGKTTVLRHLLVHSGQRLAVIVNEFGEVGIDGALLRSCGFCPEDELEGRLVELANGCLCCTVQDDFLPTMERLLERAEDLDGIVVETSGLALPEPLVAAFNWPAIRSRTRVHGVVTVVDGQALAAGHVVADPAALEAQRQADPSLDHSDAIEDLFDDQLRAADLVLISRSDCLVPEDLEHLRSTLQSRCRPGTAFVGTAHGVLDPQLLLGQRDGPDAPAVHGHDHEPDHDHDHDSHHGHDHEHEHEHHHDHSHVEIQSEALDLPGQWTPAALQSVLLELIERQQILRAKGWLAMADKARLLQIQAVGPRVQTWYEGIPQPDQLAGSSGRLKLVLLGFGLDRQILEARLEAAAQSSGIGP